MDILPCLKPPLIHVRANRRQDIIDMSHMNGENLIKLRHRKTSEFGRVVKSWNKQLNWQLKKNIGMWYKDHNIALANCSKLQRKIYGNLNHYHSEKRRIKREEHNKQRIHVRETLEQLRIKRIARRVLEKFRENVYRKKALRNARRKSKRGTIFKMKSIKEDSIEQSVVVDNKSNTRNTEDSQVGGNKSNNMENGSTFFLDTPTTAVAQLTVENVAKLDKMHEEAKSVANTQRDPRSVYKSKYLEASRDNAPRTVNVTFDKSEEVLNLPTQFTKPGDLPPLKLIRRSQIRPPPTSTIIANLQTWETDQILTTISKANEPSSAAGGFKSLPEIQLHDEVDVVLYGPKETVRHKISNATDNTNSVDGIDNAYQSKSGIRTRGSQRISISEDESSSVLSKQCKTKQSVLNRERRKEEAIYRNRILNEELPIAYTKANNGDIVVSNSIPKRTLFENHAGRWKYHKDKLKITEKEKVVNQKRNLSNFYQKLKERDNETAPKSRTPQPPFDENAPPKILRRPSLSITALLNRPFVRENDDDDLPQCSYIREFEPVLNEKHRRELRQRKQSSWQLPMSGVDQSYLAKLHQNTL